jgi:hypothetical protein
MSEHVPAHSTQDPAFERNAHQLAGLARQLADRLDILVDTAPRVLSPLVTELLHGAAESAARTLDTLAWMTEAGKPLPESAALPERTQTHARYWIWRHVTLDLVEVTSEPDATVTQHIVIATWTTRPSRAGHELEVSLFGGMSPHRDDLHMCVSVSAPWEIGAMRLLLARGSDLSPVLRTVLREILMDSLEQAPSAPGRMPPISIDAICRPLVEVAHG